MHLLIFSLPLQMNFALQNLEEELKDLGKDYQILAECLLAERESRDAEAVNIFIHVCVILLATSSC